MVTSCSTALARARLQTAGLAGPPLLITGDDVTRGKPDPDPYLLAASPGWASNLPNASWWRTRRLGSRLESAPECRSSPLPSPTRANGSNPAAADVLVDRLTDITVGLTANGQILISSVVNAGGEAEKQERIAMRRVPRIILRPGMLSRRDFIKLGGLAGAAAALGFVHLGIRLGRPGSLHNRATLHTWLSGGTTDASTSSVALRIAHITDMHVDPYGPGVDGLTRALRDVHACTPAMDFILNTGDCVMDSLEADKSRTEKQWDAFTSVLKAECRLPVFHAIGNHDVWGWGLAAGPQAEVSGDPLYGKGMALAQLGLPGRYYSFDQAGWRFLVLDSTHVPEGEVKYPYTGKLDEEQYKWLAAAARVQRPTRCRCVLPRTFRFWQLANSWTATTKARATGWCREPGCTSMPDACGSCLGSIPTCVCA